MHSHISREASREDGTGGGGGLYLGKGQNNHLNLRTRGGGSYWWGEKHCPNLGGGESGILNKTQSTSVI